MKKILSILLSVFTIALLSISGVNASHTDLKDMRIFASLKSDGTAHIQEKWTMDIDEGTEIYKVFNNMGDSKIENLSVKDEQGLEYKNIGDWDVSADKTDKDGKCGLVTNDDSYELCFGIGEYGEREYTFEYDITNFVQQYQNDQGFNYAFFSELSLEPEYVKIILDGPTDFNKENANIWAFGYYGNVRFEDGHVVMETTESVPEGAKMQLLMRMNNGTFASAHPNDQDFKDILEDAKEGSSYDESEYVQDDGYSSFVYKQNHSTVIIAIIIFCIVIFGIVIFVLVSALSGTKIKGGYQFRDGQSLKRNKEEVNFFRDIPCNKDPFEFYYLSQMLDIIGENEKSGLIAAILLRWIQKGYIEFEKEEVTHLFVFKKDGYSIDLKQDIPVTHPLEKRLLTFFRQAAGSNGVLETKEFEKWCGNHYEEIEEWFSSIDLYIKDIYQKKGLYSLESIPTKVLGFNTTKEVETYDVSIREEMEHILGFKYFLEEMSLIDEKSVIEVKMWEEYLIFASILGIADKVEEQLGKLCPTFNEQSELDTIYTMHMIHTFTRNSMYSATNAAQANASAGFGGSSSFGGGGGGFSGGGGGGVR